MSLIDSNNQPAPAAVEQSLQAALEAFKSTPAQVQATSLLRGTSSQVAPEEKVDLNVDSTEEETLAADEADEEQTTEENEKLSSDFGEQFKATFGMEPDEAISLVNELANFRDEMQLMRTWGVNATEFDFRITAVKEFYTTLPENDREQFNNPAGAAAIWNHLESTGKASVPRESKSTRAKSSVRSTKPAPQVELIKRSDILAMDDKTYRANYARINKAFQEGRVIE